MLCLCSAPFTAFTLLRIVVLAGFDALSRAPSTGFVSMLAASLICAYIYVHVCEAVWGYLIGIRPLALALITLSCLLRPRNLPPLKCGFKKKKKED